jgi:hypothetical protein
LLAPGDLARAIEAALAARARGTFHVVPRGNVPLQKALGLAGVRRLPWPAFLRRPAGHLPYLRHPWTASGERLRRELGVEALFSSAEAVLGYRRELEGRRPEPARAIGCEAPPAAKVGLAEAGLAEAGLAEAGPAPGGFDDFGLDPAYVEACRRTLLRFLHDV